jgi:hypothetical protein
MRLVGQIWRSSFIVIILTSSSHVLLPLPFFQPKICSYWQHDFSSRSMIGVIHFCSSSMHFFLTQALLLMAARYGEPGLAVRNTCYTCERPGMVDERGGEYATNHFYFLLHFMALTERWYLNMQLGHNLYE